MRTAAEIRAAIASGAIKLSDSRGSASPGEGIYECQIDSAEIGLGETGNTRGKIVCRVIGAVDVSNIGKKINVYIQTVNPGFLEEAILEFSRRCAVWGIPEERIYDRAETGVDIVGNIMVEMNRMALKGQLLCVIERKDSGKMNAKGKPNYWINWLDVSLNGASAGEPIAVPKPIVLAPVISAIVVPAPAVAPVTPAAPAIKKPWQK